MSCRASITLVALGLAVSTRAADLVARVSGPDVVVDWADPTLTCPGDLYRGNDPYQLSASPPPPYLGGALLPITVPGDGQFLGDGGLFYAVGTLDPRSTFTNLATCAEAFRLERTFTVVAGFQNIYYVSLPLIDTQADMANSAAIEDDKCVGDAGGPAAPDGLINADDYICQWWTGRQTGQGSMMITRRDSGTAAWRQRAGLIEPTTGAVTFAGEFIEPLIADEGLLVTVGGIPGTENRSLLAGGHANDYRGRTLSPASGDTVFLVSLPYHGMYQRAVEILCGLDGADWVDANADGEPDTCSTMSAPYSLGDYGGVFDGQDLTTVETFDNVPDGSASDNLPMRLSVMRNPNPRGRWNLFTGTDFALHAGEAYLVTISPAASPTLCLTPHF